MLDNALKRLVGQQRGLENPGSSARKSKRNGPCAARSRRTRVAARLRRRVDEIDAVYPGTAAEGAPSGVLVADLVASGRLRVDPRSMRRRNHQAERKRLEEFRDSRLESLRLSILSTPGLSGDGRSDPGGVARRRPRDSGSRRPVRQSGAREPVRGRRGSNDDQGHERRGPNGAARAARGAPEAIRRSTDPLIALARRVEPVIRELRDWQDNRLRSAETSAGQRIAAARFAVYGKRYIRTRRLRSDSGSAGPLVTRKTRPWSRGRRRSTGCSIGRRDSARSHPTISANGGRRAAIG